MIEEFVANKLYSKSEIQFSPVKRKNFHIVKRLKNPDATTKFVLASLLSKKNYIKEIALVEKSFRKKYF